MKLKKINSIKDLKFGDIVKYYSLKSDIEILCIFIKESKYSNYKSPLMKVLTLKSSHLRPFPENFDTFSITNWLKYDI